MIINKYLFDYSIRAMVFKIIRKFSVSGCSSVYNFDFNGQIYPVLRDGARHEDLTLLHKIYSFLIIMLVCVPPKADHGSVHWIKFY